MTISRRGFLKGSAASAVGGLLLSRREALEHPMVSAQDKEVLRQQAPKLAERREYEAGPEYVLWQDALYLVTAWQRDIYVMGGGEELRLSASRLNPEENA